MSKPFIFSVGSGHLSARVRSAVAEAGGVLINCTEPRGEKRHWFEVDNLGDPHDGQNAARVMEAAMAAATASDRKLLKLKKGE